MASGVTVVGAGILGLASAWELARRGARVRVVEAARIGAGSSGGTVGALAAHMPEQWNDKKAVQRDALVGAQGWWAGVRAAGGVDPGYARTGRLQPATDAAALAPRISAAARHWQGFTMRLTTAPPGPLVPPAPGGVWALDDLTARIAPRRALAALAAAIRAAGGTIEEGAGPLAPGDLAPDDLTGPVIWATGAPGLAALSADLGRPMGAGVKGQSALLALDCADAPQVYADGLHIVPHADGTVAIGSTSETMFSHPDPDEQLDAIIARARALCPVLAGAPVVDRWAGIRPRARTRAPLVGPWPGRPGHVVANGGFKIGFGMAPAIAAMIAALVLDGEDRIPPAFRPENG